MKKLFFVLIALVAFNIQAQEDDKEVKKRKSLEKRAFMEKLTAEEAASLKTKKMALDLDLTEAQKREINKINLEIAKERKAKREERKNRKESGVERTKPSKEERLKMMNERLDQQIATKKKIKSILNEKQYEKWEQTKKQRKRNLKKRKMNKKGGKKRGIKRETRN